MIIKRFGVCIAALCAVAAVSAATETGDKEPFWLGGDISGMNATRLRVWVNPKDGFCSPEDVLKMAKRSQALGMPVMIDFHYSDWWADPGKQNPPKAWLGMTLEQTEKALADHTRQTLRLLKDNGIDVKWVQVGNETTHGFLWPMGRFEENPVNYASLTKAGIKAVREVYPEAEVIIHLDNGFDQGLYDRVFDSLKSNGVEWDTIGISVDPYWTPEWNAEDDYRLGAFSRNMPTVIMDAFKEAASSAR